MSGRKGADIAEAGVLVVCFVLGWTTPSAAQTIVGAKDTGLAGQRAWFTLSVKREEPVASMPGSGAATAAPPASAPTSSPPRRWIAHLNLGFVAFNWVGEKDGMPSQTVTVADRQSILQLVGFGYFVRPNLRAMLGLQFVELLGGGPRGASTLTLVGAIPWVGWHPFAPEFGQLFVGAGPLLAPRNYGKNRFDVGLWTAYGVGFPVGKGFSLGGAVQVPTMFKVRTAVTIAPAAFVAYRF